MLAPIWRGDEEALRSEIAKLGAGLASPFERVGGTHFARLVVVPPLKGKRGDQIDDVSYLLFSSEHDGPVGAYLETIRGCMSREADAIWGHCVGYPGSADAVGFAAYMLDHRVKAGTGAAAYPYVTVDEVRRSLDRRRRLAAFAVESRRLERAAIQHAWRHWFPETAV